MKIGILTFHCAHNYGAVLQAFALQEQLASWGHKVEVIDYRPKYLVEPYKVLSEKSFKSSSPIRLSKDIVKYLLTVKRKKKRFVNFSEFINKNLNLSQETSGDSIPTYDLYVVGSDQVWNYKMTKGDKIYFGGFSIPENARLISYAASMEATEINGNEAILIQYALNVFTGISVREDILVDLLQPLTPKNISSVLDPTLLVNRKVWSKLATPPQRKKYILVYQVRTKPQTLEIAKKIAREIGVEVVELGAVVKTLPQAFRRETESIAQWVGWFENATFVVTTSFHGTAFSVIFNKPFYTVQLNDGNDSRSSAFLKKIGLSDRIVNGIEGVNYSPIDYTQANRLLTKKREESLSFLKEYLNEL